MTSGLAAQGGGLVGRRRGRGSVAIALFAAVVLVTQIACVMRASSAVAVAMVGRGDALPSNGVQSTLVDDVNQRVYVATGDVVAVFDFGGSLVRTIGGQSGARGMALDGGFVYVALTGSGEISKIDRTALVVVATYQTGQTVDRSLVVLDGKVWFVCGWAQLCSLDLATSAVSNSGNNPLDEVQYGLLRVVPNVPHRLLYTTYNHGSQQIDVATSAVQFGVVLEIGGEPPRDPLSADGLRGWYLDSSQIVEWDRTTNRPSGRVYGDQYDGSGGSLLYVPGHGGTLLHQTTIAGSSDTQVHISLVGRPTMAQTVAVGPELYEFAAAASGDRLFGASLDPSDNQMYFRSITFQQSLTSVLPAPARIGGSPAVQIVGVGVGGVDTVTVDGVPSPLVIPQTETTLQAVVPAGLADGTHSLVVQTPWGPVGPIAVTTPLTIVEPATETDLPLAGSPGRLVRDPAHQRTFVSADNAVVALGPDDRIVGVVPRLWGAFDMSVIGDHLVVSEVNAGRLTVIDIPSLTVVAQWNVGSPTGFMTTVGNVAYVVTRFHLYVGPDHFVATDLATGVTTTRAPSTPNPETFYVVAAIPGTNHIALRDNEAFHVYDTVSDTYVLNSPYVAFLGASPDGATLWTSSYSGNASELSASDLTPTGRTAPVSGRLAFSSAFGGIIAGQGNGTNGAMVAPVNAAAPSHRFSPNPYDLGFADDGSLVFFTQGYSGPYTVSRADLTPTLEYVTGTAVNDQTATLSLLGTGIGAATGVTIDGTLDLPVTNANSTTQLSVVIPSGLAPGDHQLVLHNSAYGDLGPRTFHVYADVPNAPASVTAVAHDASAGVSWSAVTCLRGACVAPVTSYAVTASPGGHTCSWTTGPLSCVVSGLTNGTAYTFRVTAANANGPGAASVSSNKVTPFSVPGAPTIATVVALNAQAAVTWTAPSSDGGSPITSYTVTASPGGTTCTWSSGPLSCVVPGLTNATAYTFTVTATNVHGTGAQSSPSSTVTPWGITSLSSQQGPTSGGQLLIRGNGFTGATAVKFGTAPAIFVVASDNYILAVVPPHPAGYENVYVTTPAGTTAAALSSFYIYTATAPGSIAGTVTAATGGAPVSGMELLVTPAASNTYRALGFTAPDGTFRVDNLLPGTYRLSVFDPADVFGAPSHYLSQYYNNVGPATLPETPGPAPGFTTATTITVTSNATTTLSTIALTHTP